jgi:hypothetical protein
LDPRSKGTKSSITKDPPGGTVLSLRNHPRPGNPNQIDEELALHFQLVQAQDQVEQSLARGRSVVERPFRHKVIGEQENLSPSWDRTIVNAAFHSQDLIVKLSPVRRATRCNLIPESKKYVDIWPPHELKGLPKAHARCVTKHKARGRRGGGTHLNARGLRQFRELTQSTQIIFQPTHGLDKLRGNQSLGNPVVNLGLKMSTGLVPTVRVLV